MKKLLFLILLAPVLSYSQLIVDDVDVNQTEAEWLTATIYLNELQTNFLLHIDYGQEYGGKMVGTLRDKITDNGQKMKFTGCNQAVHFIESKGWQVVDWQYLERSEVWIYRMKRKE